MSFFLIFSVDILGVPWSLCHFISMVVIMNPAPRQSHSHLTFIQFLGHGAKESPRPSHAQAMLSHRTQGETKEGKELPMLKK